MNDFLLKERCSYRNQCLSYPQAGLRCTRRCSWSSSGAKDPLEWLKLHLIRAVYEPNTSEKPRKTRQKRRKEPRNEPPKMAERCGELSSLRQEISELLSTNGRLHQHLGQLNGCLPAAGEPLSAAMPGMLQDLGGKYNSQWIIHLSKIMDLFFVNYSNLM